MIRFLDDNGNKVELTFSQNRFQVESKHVLVICQFEDGWLLTKHKQRGIEFPGGKRESGETLEEAARRETYEETGAILADLNYLAQYMVYDEMDPFVKTVFWGKVKRVAETSSYYETNGPVIVNGDLLQLRFGEEYSFIMKDQVVGECVNYINLKQSEKE
ncbi:Putative 8-oxo-dGTP diphosphatase YtkD [Neobacillus rhizosphaerae]|uniref:8-oxo-dGTP diphosphatase YtkD n=1 Tax=Neobacillus rhizosphaerae TaxID=2880965 RepID=A0ABM9EXY3_9BACI|nr:nucleoside triphosphatase YtkD [Neobacillus rhizosphaerae]CAH2717577.1 Putative 8-oxo-dGTP diphosphatase YtkD [Neobacillus rhizosphaerae]